ncbi:MAG: hypothetical protein ACK45Y_01965 [Betaproteobacteria bacterium]|jgi:hypothetical protein
MRELTMGEVESVSGGILFLVVAIANHIYRDKPVDGNAASSGEMPDYNNR